MFYKGKKFSFKDIEHGLYDFWNTNHYFDPLHYEHNKKNFSIILPPPNITGHLHLGHAWDGTIQDVIIRYKKLQGFNTCWLPGMDHAGIATQTKFDKVLKEQNKKYSDKKAYLNALTNWVSEQKIVIHSQWAKLGFALSYANETYTLDDNVKKLVDNVFIKLYEKGLIYQDYKLTNWDVKLKSAVSDIEVIHKPTTGKMYYFKYYLDSNPKEYLTIATTRPETMFGDIAIFINPNDERYLKYLNQYAINPVNQRKLKIYADEYIDIKFGTGVMKCTPAHDFNDYELAKKHNLTDYHSVMNLDGTLADECAIANKSYSGLDRLYARNKIVQHLQDLDLVVKIENHDHEIGYSERTNEVIEPLLSKQWFVKMQPIVDELYQTLKKDPSTFLPPRFEKTLTTWLEKINDWCISRQLLWGHKIPVYYGKNSEIYVGLNPPKGYEQDPSVLDTWFSSGLWPLATTVYNSNHDCSCFYPVNLLVTAYDILFFWVARMLFQCNNLSQVNPLNQILIHGLVRDANNKKMSKSLDNGIEPNNVIDEYGCDALRLFLISGSTLGEDLRFDTTKLIYMTNFLNKLWNVHNLLDNHKDYHEVNQFIHPINSWMIDQFNQFIKKITKLFDEYNFSVLVTTLIDFVWNTYCNTYLELIHPLINSDIYRDEALTIANNIYQKISIILHPICPFITENIYQMFNYKLSSVMLESFPSEFKHKTNEEQTKLTSMVIGVINKLRELRIKANIKSITPIEINLINVFLAKHRELVVSLCGTYNIQINQISNQPVNKEFKILKTDECIIEYLDNFKDEATKKEELLKELKRLESEIKRSESILGNKNFIAKASQEKVQNEKDKYAKYLADYQTIKSLLK